MQYRLKRQPDFLADGGLMGERICRHDWSATPLGVVAGWPQSLRTVLGMMIHSKLPTYLAWGPELTGFYNDAYIPVLGKKPEALGRPFRDVWSEAWDILGPIVEQALAGDAGYFEDMPLILERQGYPEQTWWTFSYSPVFDETGGAAGVMCIVHETTAKVLGGQRLDFLVRLSDRLRRLNEPTEVIAAAQVMLGEHLKASRVGYGEVEETERYFTTNHNWTDGTVAHQTGTHDLAAFGPEIHGALRRGETLVVRDAAADPHTNSPEHLAAFAFLEMSSVVTVSLVKQGRMVAALYVHGRAPRLWNENEVKLIEDVAERTWEAVERARAEAALRDSEARLRLALDAGRMAVWEHETATDRIVGSPELNRLLGYPAEIEVSLNDLRQRFYPGDRDRLTAAATEALQRGERFFEAEFRFRRPDGEARWFLMRAEMLMGPNGTPARTIGVILDIDDRKQVEEALIEREAELRAALEAGSLAIFDYDHVKGIMNPSPRLSALYGYPPDHVLTLADIRNRYHPEDVAQILDRRDRDQEDENLRNFEWTLRLLMPDGTIRWVNGRGEYLRDHEGGRILRSRGVVMDITERKRWEEHQQLLIHELNHRVKNTLATVQSIASQTLRNAHTMESARSAMEARLLALSRAHDVLTRENWEGAGLLEIVRGAMDPYRHERERRIRIDGPDVRLSPRMALAIAMALQELATNAVKYGALSNAQGNVRIAWSVIEAPQRHLHLTWSEANGPTVRVPQRRGFGTRLIERSLAQDLHGQANIDFAPGGVLCTVNAPLA